MCVHGLVLQLCPTLCDAMRCIARQASLSMGFSLKGIAHALLQGIFPTQGLKPQSLTSPVLAPSGKQKKKNSKLRSRVPSPAFPSLL